MTRPVTIIDSNPKARQQIEAALARMSFKDVQVSETARGEGAVVWIGGRGEEPPAGTGENDRFVKPVRIGAVLERVRRLQAMKEESARVAIGPYALDPASSELLLKNDRAVRLTDKEKQILMLLSEARGRPVGREILLEKVWGYAPDLDTHTLETHIYRLRQKIENDPAQPEILLTDGAGYKILF